MSEYVAHRNLAPLSFATHAIRLLLHSESQVIPASFRHTRLFSSSWKSTRSSALLLLKTYSPFHRTSLRIHPNFGPKLDTMPPSSFLTAVRQADALQVPLTDMISHVIQSPPDRTGPTSLRPWSIPLHLTREDMTADLSPIGWLRPTVRAFLEYHWPEKDLGEAFIQFGIARESQRDGTEGNCHQDGPEFAFFSREVLEQGYEGITREMNRLAGYMRDKGMFEECLCGQSFSIPARRFSYQQADAPTTYSCVYRLEG